MNELALKNTLATWLELSLGRPMIVDVIFDADFVAGNSISFTITSTALVDALTPVVFTTNQATTLALLARRLQDSRSVFKAVVTGARTIRMTMATNGLLYTFASIVTGGVSQALSSFATIQTQFFCPVIFADQNAPRPSFPYATVRISDIVKTSHDENRQITPAGIYEVGGERRATIAVNYFGENPVQEILKAYNCLGREEINKLFIAANIALIDKNPVQNLTDVLETEYEPHSYFDFFLALSDNVEDDLGLIESVQTTGTYRGTSSGSSYVDVDLIESVV